MAGHFTKPAGAVVSTRCHEHGSRHVTELLLLLKVADGADLDELTFKYDSGAGEHTTSFTDWRWIACGKATAHLDSCGGPDPT